MNIEELIKNIGNLDYIEAKDDSNKTYYTCKCNLLEAYIIGGGSTKEEALQDFIINLIFYASTLEDDINYLIKEKNINETKRCN